MAHAWNPNMQIGRLRQENHDFEDILGFIVSFRPTWATVWNPVSKKVFLLCELLVYVLCPFILWESFFIFLVYFLVVLGIEPRASLVLSLHWAISQPLGILANYIAIPWKHLVIKFISWLNYFPLKLVFKSIGF
jgi:hypothetical protein